MLILADNIFLSILCGLGISVIITFVFYLVAIIMEIQMSLKSFLFSTVMFFLMWLFSSQICSGLGAKQNLNDSGNYIEELYKMRLSKIDVPTTQKEILGLHPHLDSLLEIVDIQTYTNSQIFIDDAISILNHNIWRKAGYLFATILICGIPAFLLGERRVSYRENKRSRHAGRTNTRKQRMRSRHI